MVSLFLGHIIFLLLKLQVFNYGLKKEDNKKIKNLGFENIQKQLIFYMEIYVLHTINYEICIYCRSYRAVAEHNVCYSVCMYLSYTVDCLRTCFCYRPESSVFVNCVSHSTFKRNFVAYIKWQGF